ncbi:MAG: hypothetical protein A2Z27_01940 [candidate division Zixibacteria bacterium RBG_16_50_21]|nr:MAG: hypothetical protein A2Z27_01940 [candidate division Zixibacteria bacterium RBG_16_50_21]
MLNRTGNKEKDPFRSKVMLKIVSALACIVLLSLVSVGQAYDNWGASVAAAGMGGAYVAVAGDPSGIFYNPAGLAKISQYMLYGMYNRQTLYGYISDEKPYTFATAGALPFSQAVMAFGFIQRGSWAKQTRFVTHNVLALSFARMFSPKISLGANAKFLFNSNYGDKSGAEVDLGLMVFATPGLTFGLAGENLAGTEVEPTDLGTYFLYNRRQVKLGMAYELSSGDYRTHLGVDVIFKEKKGLVSEGSNLNNLGIEQSLPFSSNSAVSLRAGYSLGKDYNQDFNSYAFGFSYELRSGNSLYRFDYSYQDYPFKSSESLAGDNRLALTVAFGAPKNANSLARQKEKLNLAAFNKKEKKPTNESAALNKPSPQSAVQTRPDDSKSRSQTDTLTKTDAKPSVPQPPAEVKDTTSRTLAQSTPEESKAVAGLVAGGVFKSLMITSQAKSNKDKSYLLLFQYNLEKVLEFVSEWKILISSSPSDSFLTKGSDFAVLQTISGLGIPPTAVLWDALDKTGKRVAAGKYYYTMYLKNNQGDKFLSGWNPLLVE